MHTKAVMWGVLVGVLIYLLSLWASGPQVVSLGGCLVGTAVISSSFTRHYDREERHRQAMLQRETGRGMVTADM
jgi:hypothetical protein